MGMMPQWLAKTREMYAFDQHFSLGDGRNAEAKLVRRYEKALKNLKNGGFWKSDSQQMLTKQKHSPKQVKKSIDGHFLGDWINVDYPKVAEGGLFWPQVPSQRVIDQLRAGVTLSIALALGRKKLAKLVGTHGLSDKQIEDLYRIAEKKQVDTRGVLPIVMSWVCIAPAGDTYFEVDAVRGPTVVQFVVATPRPFGHSSVINVVHSL